MNVFHRSPKTVEWVMNKMHTGRLKLQFAAGSSDLSPLQLIARNTSQSTHTTGNLQDSDDSSTIDQSSWDHISLHHMVALQISEQRSVFGNIAHGLHRQREFGGCGNSRNLEGPLNDLEELKKGSIEAIKNKLVILPTYQAHNHVGSRKPATIFLYLNDL